jgi:hypothetical protein
MSDFRVAKGLFLAEAERPLCSVGGLSFQPTAVIAWWTNQLQEGSAPGNRGGVGFWTAHGCVATAWASTNGTLKTCTAHAADDAALLGCDSVAESIVMRAELNSFDEDAFTLRWSTPPRDSWLVHFLALGGAAVTGATAGWLSSAPQSGARGNEVRHPNPDLILVAPTALDSVGGCSRGLLAGIGAASGTEAASAVFISPDQGLIGSPVGAQRTDAAVLILRGTDPVEAIGIPRILRGSNPAVHWSVSPPEASVTGYLALSGLRCKVGPVGSPPKRGLVRTRVGFRPEALLFFSWGLRADSGTKRIGRLCLGGAAGGHSGCAGWGDANAAVPRTRTHVTSSTGRVVIIADTRGGADHAAAALDSVHRGGFTLDWTESDHADRQVIYVALGPPRAHPLRDQLLRRGARIAEIARNRLSRRPRESGR